MKLSFILFILAATAPLCLVFGQEAKVDAQLMDSLKTEANHDQTRRDQFQDDKNAKKVFSNEREKGLGAFLEEQEKWDLIRERGLGEHRKQKQAKSPQEGGPEYIEDQKAKNIESQKMEQARKVTVQTREQIVSKRSSHFNHDELEELNLLEDRPRYAIRKRGQNKWVKNGAPGSKPAGSTGGTGYGAPPPAFDDYPIQNDYVPAPAPIEGFEEIPPPPPPVNYDGSGGAINGFPYNGNIDSGFGEPPPPPPPPIFDDFN